MRHFIIIITLLLVILYQYIFIAVIACFNVEGLPSFLSLNDKWLFLEIRDGVVTQTEGSHLSILSNNYSPLLI